MFLSIIVFVLVYVLLATEKLEQAVAALLGASAVILMHLISFEDAVQAIDFNVIFLLVGMMTCVAILGETGFFEWVAISIAKSMKGRAAPILIMLLSTTMIFSALLDNVTTVILLAPVTILITQLLELPTMAFLILEALASNIGGTATLIGDPPNIIIGSRADLSFNDFLVHLAPCVLIIALVFLATAYLLLRRKLHAPAQVRQHVIDSCPELALRDVRKMKRSMVVFALIFAGFFLHRTIDVPAGVIAMGGMAVMLCVCYSKSEEMLRVVEWDSILFFVGLFIIIGALDKNGVIDGLARLLFDLCGHDLMRSSILILWSTALLSSVLNNIPLVIVMMPMLQKLLVQTGHGATGDNPLFWALALGSCLGGNGTLVGASSNVVIGQIGARNGYRISFGEFFKWGMPLMLQSILIATVYLWLRYFQAGGG